MNGLGINIDRVVALCPARAMKYRDPVAAIK